MAEDFEPEIEIDGDTVVVVAEPTGARPDRRTTYGLLALLAAGVVGVALWLAAGGDADADEPVADEADIGETADEPAAATNEPAGGVAAIELSATRTATDGPGDGTYLSDVTRVVPWKGGFLAVRSHYQDTPLPEFEEGVRELYPDEIAETVQAAGATTVDEARAALEEAGLLEQAMEIFYANEGVLTELQPYSVQTFEVVTSEDGIEWSDPHPIEGDFDHVSGVAVGGGRLVLAVQRTPTTEEDDGSYAVMITEDLETWDTIELDGVISRDVPEFVRDGTWVGEIAVSDTGWLAVVQASTWVEMETLLPPGTLDDYRGYDWGVSDQGIQIGVSGDESFDVSGGSSGSVSGDMAETDDCCAEPVPTTEPSTGPESQPEPQLFTWSELGITYDEYKRYGESIGESYGVGASWGDPAAKVLIDVDPGTMISAVGTPRGFITVAPGSADVPTARFSADGSTWTDSPLPTRGYVNGVVPVEGGVIVIVSSGSGTEFWLGDETASAWRPVDVPGLPAGGQIQINSPGPGLVASVEIYDPGEPAGTQGAVSGPVDFTVEVDGLVVEWHFDTPALGDGDMTVEITDAETGEIRLSETVAVDAAEVPEWVVEGDSALTFLDPVTLEPIVVLPYTLQADAWEAAYAEAGVDVSGVSDSPAAEPDRWFVATTDGIAWLVVDMEDHRWLSAGAVSGGVAIVDDGTGWSRFTS